MVCDGLCMGGWCGLGGEVVLVVRVGGEKWVDCCFFGDTGGAENYAE